MNYNSTGPVREGKIRTAPHGARAGPVSGLTIFVQNSLWTAQEQPVRGPGVWCDWGIIWHQWYDIIWHCINIKLSTIILSPTIIPICTKSKACFWTVPWGKRKVGWDAKSYVWDNSILYVIGWVSKSYVCTCTVAMSYGWDVKSWDKSWLCHTEEFVSHPYEIDVPWLYHTNEMLSPTDEIATDLLSSGRDSKSYVCDRYTIS